MSEAPANPAAQKKTRKLLWVALVSVLLLMAAGGAGAWYLLKPQLDAMRAAQPKKPLYLTLEPFTVNLQDPRGERFAQIAISLQFEDPQTDLLVRERLPAVRNDVLLLIASKRIDELLTPEGKQKLSSEIRTVVGQALAPRPGRQVPAESLYDDDGEPVAPRPPRNPIQAVLFSQFIVQ